MKMLAAIGCVGAAAYLHGSFCEWKTVEYASREQAEFSRRVIFSFGKKHHPDGNAAMWRAEKKRLSLYNKAWLDCHAQVHGQPAPDSALDRCIRTESAQFAHATATVKAVVLASCLMELERAIPGQEQIGVCLQDVGYRDSPRPRWTREVVGRLFEEPYDRHTALFAEELFPPLWQRPAGIGLGLVVPCALCVTAMLLARSIVKTIRNR